MTEMTDQIIFNASIYALTNYDWNFMAHTAHDTHTHTHIHSTAI